VQQLFCRLRSVPGRAVTGPAADRDAAAAPVIAASAPPTAPWTPTASRPRAAMPGRVFP
jgi:hypothetical protein